MTLVVVNRPHVSDHPDESVEKAEIVSYLDASQDTDLAFNSNWLSTVSRVACNWHSRET